MGDGVGVVVTEAVSDGVKLEGQVQVSVGDAVSLCVGVLVLWRIGVEVQDGTGLGRTVQGNGVAEGEPGVRLKVGEGDGGYVGVAGMVGGERSSLPGEGEDLSRQSPAWSRSCSGGYLSRLCPSAGAGAGGEKPPAPDFPYTTRSTT